jgi:WbqC-like protein family
VIVTGHQVNFLPGCSVTAKIAAADCCVWMDEMQYERHGFVNRNRLADGTKLTIPVSEHDTFAPINRVRIGDPTGRGREKVARTLEHQLGDAGAPFAAEIRRPYRLLVGLNARLLRLLLDALGITVEEHFQSHLGAGRYEATSNGLADMVAELGGTTWLSGPSGRAYLDEMPFRERGIRVEYFEFEGANPSAVELLRDRVAV